ncbi:MAG TPA: VIT1/CCC1 transporter family protein, partial [Holophagaceae bacterium]|nr:VIT1/CCC1 transporter family protein [Holophagaceae bacterium]
EAVRDMVLGMSDGLTVPFALAAGLTGAVADGHVIVTAGLAEIAAGAIAMGLGGFLAARSQAEHYDREHAREQREIVEVPEAEAAEVREILEDYGLSHAESSQLVDALRARPNDWVRFMMRFELGLEPPVPGRAWRSALTIGLSYAVGGLVPLSAYMLVKEPHAALKLSMAATLAALLLFGYLKARIAGTPRLKGALSTALVGALAAAAAYGLARLVS